MYLVAVSIVADFPYELVPKPRISYQNDQDLPGAVVLLCRFDFPQWSNVSFSVQWSTNRVKKTERLLCPHAQNGNGQACDIRESELHYERKLDNGDGYMPGDEVTCTNFVWQNVWKEETRGEGRGRFVCWQGPGVSLLGNTQKSPPKSACIAAESTSKN